ncbi:MAG: hypothetical protein RIC14_12365 [Filomicrobium sp.]
MHWRFAGAYAATTIAVAALCLAFQVGFGMALSAAAQSVDLESETFAGPRPIAITWRVENAFRFFSDAADTEVHRATYFNLPEDVKRKSPVLAAERALAERFSFGWAQEVSGKTCWDSEKNWYGCDAAKRSDYINPKEHAVLVQVSRVPDAVQVDCVWKAVPTPTGKRSSDKRGKTRVERQPCSEPARLNIPFPHGARVTVHVGGRQIAVAKIKVTDLFIVGMGDSFGSGEGNPDVPVRFSRERSADYSSKGDQPALAGFPARVGSWRQIGDRAFIEENARWVDQACHRSLYSHQLRAALQLAIEDPHRAVTFVGLACSGADIIYGLFLRYKGNEWVPNPPQFSQISALAEAQCGGRAAKPKDLPEAYHMRGQVPELEGHLVLRECSRRKARKVDLLMLSIGGNDIGFARLVANAVLDDKSALKKLSGWFGGLYGTAEASARLDNLDERYKAFNRALHYILHIPWDEADRVLLTAYPPMALIDEGRRVCPDGTAGMEVDKAFRLSTVRARAGIWVGDKLHRKMKRSARAHRWSFVDAHVPEFFGRGLCAGYTKGALRSADDLRIPRKVDGAWVPYNPADYEPYATRQRWFRTPNDAFMTGNFHVSQSILRKVLNLNALSRFQLTLAATYSGAFHPTAEGHAAIADAVVVRAREVLDKYARRR